jgi:single-strand DNA-binding protein
VANVNKVILIGRLTRDPELRYTPSGVAVCDLGIAVGRKWKTPDGSWKEETCFVDVTVWKKQAENCAEYLKKGREAYIEGRLVLDQWQAPDGQKRSKLKVVAMLVQFLGGKPTAAAAAPAAAGGEPPAPAGGEPPVEEPPPDEGGEEPPF